MKSQKNSSPLTLHSEPSEFDFTKLAIRFALIYWIFAVTWIFFSDQLLVVLWQGSDLFNVMQTYKGWFFVSFTSVIIYFALSGRIPLTAVNLYQKAKNAETARSEVEKKLKGLSRSNLIGFFVGHVQGPILEANQEFLRMVGYSEGDLQNAQLTHQQLSANESCEKDAHAAEELLARGYCRTYEKDFIHKSGRLVPVLIGATTFNQDRSRMIAFVLDLTEFKKTEQERNQTQERLRLALEATSDSVWEWNLETDETYYSPKWFTMLGYQINEFPANLESWKKITKPSDVDRVLQTIQDAVQQGLGFDVEYQMRSANGQWQWIKGCGKVSVWDKSGKPLRMSGTHTDVTEKKLAQIEAEKMREQLLQSQKVESIGRLAGGVAHDFNNILTSIIGFAELAKNHENHFHHLNQICISAERGAKLTNQLLYYARKKPIEPQVVRLREVLLKIQPLLENCVGEKIKLELSCADVDDHVHVDIGSIEQVIINMCINARDAILESTVEGFSGQVILSISQIMLDAPTAALMEVSPGSYVLMKVTDNGSGMTSDVKKRIFEPFFTTKPEGAGTGLGLSVCQGILKQCDGNIMVESRPQLGTTFFIYIPKFKGNSTVKSVKVSYPMSVEMDSLQPKTILVVEDDDSIREFTKEYLSFLKYNVLIAKDGEEALQVSQKHSQMIDLLVTDVVMPKMEGPELVRRLKETRKKIKIIYTSGYLKDNVLHNDLILDQTEFIQKPFRPDELAQVVRQLLSCEV